MRKFDERNVDKLLANVVELHLLKALILLGGFILKGLS